VCQVCAHSLFGFTPLPAAFYAALAVMVLVYLLLVMVVRRQVERHN
jgi:uncharacterized membrane protein YkvI